MASEISNFKWPQQLLALLLALASYVFGTLCNRLDLFNYRFAASTYSWSETRFPPIFALALSAGYSSTATSSQGKFFPQDFENSKNPIYDARLSKSQCSSSGSPVHLVPPPIPLFVQINKYRDRTCKVLILVVDAGLNYFFLCTVKERLVSYNDLTKCVPLVSFNAKLIVLSVSMDLMLICLMDLKNQVAYMAKLNIEMFMASLITKIARNSVEARSNEFIVQSSSHNHSHFHTTQSNTAIGLQPRVNVSAVSKMRGPSEERPSFRGIRTFKEVDITVMSLRMQGGTMWRNREIDSGAEERFGRKQVSKMGSEDELPLAPNV